MIARLVCWLGCSMIGALVVILTFMNGLPDVPKAKTAPRSVAKPGDQQIVKATTERK